MPNGVSVAHVGVEFGSERPWLAQLLFRSSGLPKEASLPKGSRFQRVSRYGAIWLAQSPADRAGDSTGRFTVSNCLF